MNATQKGELPQPRSKVAVGTDCTAEYLGRSDNSKARVELWKLTMGSNVFRLDLMKMLHRPDTAPWVFGSLYEDVGNPGKPFWKQVWSFRDDLRVVKHNFVGDVYTEVRDDEPDKTYVVFKQFNILKHRLLLSELLGVPQPAVASPAIVIEEPLSELTHTMHAVDSVVSESEQSSAVAVVASRGDQFIVPSSPTEPVHVPATPPMVREVAVPFMKRYPSITRVQFERMRDKTGLMCEFVDGVLNRMSRAPEHLRLS